MDRHCIDCTENTIEMSKTYFCQSLCCFRYLKVVQNSCQFAFFLDQDPDPDTDPVSDPACNVWISHCFKSFRGQLAFCSWNIHVNFSRMWTKFLRISSFFMEIFIEKNDFFKIVGLLTATVRCCSPPQAAGAAGRRRLTVRRPWYLT